MNFPHPPFADEHVGGVTPKEWLENSIAIRAICGESLRDIDHLYGIGAMRLGIDIPEIYEAYTA